MIILDASMLIAHLDSRDALHERAREALLEVAAQPLAASALTLAEVLVGPARQSRLDQAGEALRSLGVEPLSLGPDAPSRLARLRAETGLKLPDCCVLLAAQDAPAGSVVTFDDRLRRAAAGLRLA